MTQYQNTHRSDKLKIKPGAFFGASTIHPKLHINAPNDRYEQQADAMADRVMRMEEEEEMMQAMPLEGGIQRMCADCAEEEESLQTMPLMRSSTGAGGYEASPELSEQLQQSKGGGAALPAATQARMSRSFGADFSGVKIHTGSQAAAMNQSIQAKAFTHGSDIYFNEGQYQPGSSNGNHLLAHELTHVVQQGGGSSIQRSLLGGLVGAGVGGVLGGGIGAGIGYAAGGGVGALIGGGIGLAAGGLIGGGIGAAASRSSSSSTPSHLEIVDDDYAGNLQSHQRRAALSCPITCNGLTNVGTLHSMGMFYHQSRTSFNNAPTPSDNGVGTSLHFVENNNHPGCNCDDFKIIQIIETTHPAAGRDGAGYVDNGGTATPFYANIGVHGNGIHPIPTGYGFQDEGQDIRSTHSIYDLPYRATTGLNATIEWQAEACVICEVNSGPDRVLGGISYGFRLPYNTSSNAYETIQGIGPTCLPVPSSNFIRVLNSDPTVSGYDFVPELGPGDFPMPDRDATTQFA